MHGENETERPKESDRELLGKKDTESISNRPSTPNSNRRLIPNNTPTAIYIPANDSNTGFIRKKYHEEYMTPYIAEYDFDQIIDRASIICAKAYNKVKNHKMGAHPIYRILLMTSFFFAAIFLLGVMVDGEKRFWIWCIFLWFSLLFALIVLFMTFISTPPKKLDFKQIAENNLAKFCIELNDNTYAVKGMAWGIGPNYDYIRLTLPKGGTDNIFTEVNGWWCLGHMLIYSIARENLSPENLEAIDYIISTLDTDLSKYSILEHACFPDDFKASGFSYLNWAHYMDNPYIDGITPEEANLKNDLGLNVIWCIEQSLKTLLFNVKEGIYSNGMLEKSIMLHYLIHCMGDIHQPMHNIERYSKEHLSGDRGGNLFKLNVRMGDNGELHFFHDNLLDMYPESTRPYTPEYISLVNNWASNISAQYPESLFSSELDITDPNLISKEVFEEAKSCYDIEEGSIPDSKYISAHYQRDIRFIAIGGYRLKNILNKAINAYLNNGGRSS